MVSSLTLSKKENKSWFKKIIVSLILFFSIFSLSGCQSTNKNESYLETGLGSMYLCTYDANTNSTDILLRSSVENNTIYTIKQIHVEFDFYFNDTKVGNEEITFDISIEHGTTQTINRQISIDGRINKIVYKNWYADYLNVWDTYLPWWITMIVITSLLLLSYIILISILDLDIAEVFEFIADNLYSLLAFLPMIIVLLWGTISSNWVSALIVVGGTFALIFLCLNAHFVKSIFEYVGGFIFAILQGKRTNAFNTNVENIEEYINDEEKLMMFSIPTLKDYCRNNEIKGFSTLNKSGLVSLIMNHNENINNNKDSHDNSSKKKLSSTNTNKITFDSIVGLTDAKRVFKEKVILPFEHPELFKKFGKKAGGGILLYGLPGTGKTMFAEAASNELNATFISIKCSDIKSKWYGESEQKIKAIFSKAKKSEKAIIFFDEFEAIGAKRTDDSFNYCNNDLVSEILAEMQGVGSSKIKSTIIVIAATNKPWAIDSAFMRPGRFDEKIYIPLPDYDARKALFEIQLKKLPLSEDLDFDYLAKITEGFNGADIKEVCEKLKMSAINDSLEKGIEQTIGMDDVNNIEKNIKSSVSQEDIRQLEEFEKGLL